MPFFENAIELDTYLISDYPQVVDLAEHLFQLLVEVDKNRIKTKREEYRSKETLKIILINLIVGYESGVAIQYSRRKSKYSKNRRYGKIFFKYDRVIPIIDILTQIQFIDNWTGFYDRERGFSRESRMAARSELIELFYKYNIDTIEHRGITPLPVDELIQLRDKDRNDIKDIEDKYRKRMDLMTEDLIRYNKFIEKQEVSFDLTQDVLVNFYFLNIMLKPKVNKGIVKIIDFIGDEHIKIGYEGEEIQGYKLNGKDYLIMDGTGSDRAKKMLLKSHNFRNSNYKIYYNQYINHNTNKYTNNNTNKIQNNNTPMTGTNIEKFQENKEVEVDKSTTIKTELKKMKLSDYGISCLSFRSNYQYLHRVFNLYPENGGRFFGAVHINMPKEVRKCIIINGSPTVELDYSAHHIRMLYHLMDTEYDKDPYEELCEKDSEERPVYKIVSLISINAKDEKSAVKAIRDELFVNGIQYDCTDKSIKPCIDKFKKCHEPIARFLNSGRGGDLQFRDSEITDVILSTMVKEGVPCLPVHDSYIVPEKYKDFLRQTMIESYQAVMGNFLPVIK